MDNEKLNFNEIRCPYCRKKQNKLIPYYELPHVKKIHGVNWLDESILTNTYHTGSCHYEHFDTYYNQSVICLNNCVIKISDGKTYCYFHQKIIQKEIAKKKAKEEKEKAKEEAKKAMMEKKEKEKEAKKQAKNQKNKATIVLCQAILKYGDKKGEPCGKKVVKENCCLRHYNLIKDEKM